MKDSRTLRRISPRDIGPNPENPRIVFRQEEMESLLVSIDKHGIQVPLTVYKDGSSYKLIDGERRWRCAKKLNLKTVPAIVQAKPSELANLVLMYNIHALREQWDYYTIASKLKRVISLFENENGIAPNESTLSELTGLTRGAIRRCQLLIDLPERFQTMLLQELEKPKSQQRLSEDFFIEMEKSLKAVTRRLPEYRDQIDTIRDTLISKFKKKTISAVTDFRQLSKIATSKKGVGIDQNQVKDALDLIFARNNSGIKEIYGETVEFAYEEKKFSRYMENVSIYVDAIVEDDRASDLDQDLVQAIQKLHVLLGQVLDSLHE